MLTTGRWQVGPRPLPLRPGCQTGDPLQRRRILRYLLLALLLVGCSEQTLPPDPEVCFRRHVIDASGAGADGVHSTDINGDGHPDVVSGWEESEELKLYLHPGAGVTEPESRWTRVDVRGGQRVTGIEDAAFADLDDDGKPESIISATEGEGRTHNRRIRIHRWQSPGDIEDPANWHGSVIHRDAPTERFMRVRSAQLDGRDGADIVAISGDVYEDDSKRQAPSRKGGVFLYTAPPVSQLTDPGAWQRSRLADLHKGKTIELRDMDRDGDLDILYSGARNVVSLYNPGDNVHDTTWHSHWVGTGSDFAICDVNGDGTLDVVATASRKEYPVVARWFRGLKKPLTKNYPWTPFEVRIEQGLPQSILQPLKFSLKSIACGRFRPHIDTGGLPEFVITTSGAGYGILLVVPTGRGPGKNDIRWRAIPVTSYRWVTKYDNVIPLDMDGDGDTDLLTSEENEGWLLRGAGVLWYENKACNPDG